MRKKWLLFIVVGWLILVSQFGFNDYLEPNPEKLDGASFQGEGESLPFRVSNRRPNEAHYLLIPNAKNTALEAELALEFSQRDEVTDATSTEADRSGTASANSERDFRPYYYRIDPTQLKIVALDYQERRLEPHDHYCLTKELRRSLQAILKNADICESPEVEVPPAHVRCPASYTLPFLILVFRDGAVKLGEKQTSCDYPTSLCGQAHQQIRDWVKNVRSQLKNLRAKDDCDSSSQYQRPPHEF